MKTIRIILALVIAAATSSPAWARMPRSREFCGTVAAIAADGQELIVTESSGNRLTAIWTKDTVFVHEGKVSDASALLPAQHVCAFYRSPWFGRVYVTKVVW